MSRANTLFKKFQIKECLKKDEHTGVYLAYHIYLDKNIILKTLDTNNLPDLTILERFKREAKILAKLEHPNIIKVLDFGMFEQFFYISFEYFDSRNLSEVIHNNNLSDQEKKNLVLQLLNGLNEAHSNKIIHRDIKPENILVDNNYQLKIADFGLALLSNEESITRKSTVVGTPGYMSPEQITGELLTGQSDLFSAGIVIYELYTGKNPFRGNDLNQTINNILKVKTDEFIEKNESIPVEIKSVLEKLLAKKTAERISTAGEALNYFPDYNAVPLQSKSPIINRKKSYLIITAIFLLLLFFVLTNRTGEEEIIPINEIIPQQSDETAVLSNVESDTPVSAITNQSEIQKRNDNSDENIQTEIKNEINYGSVNVECIPWAEVFIDGKRIDATPLKEVIYLPEGAYKLSLAHPDYPQYEESIKIKGDELLLLQYNLQMLFAYFDCMIYPWGEIYIDGKNYGTTPLTKPIVLLPGSYLLEIRNPMFPFFTDTITLSAGKTEMYKMNFEKVSN